MKQNEEIVSKMVVAASTVAPSDYTGQLAQMLAVVHDDLLTRLSAQLDTADLGPAYARPYQLAKRWSYSEGGLRPYLYAAEQSGEVKTLLLTDSRGRTGQLLYNIRDLERYFAANPLPRKK